MPAPLSSAKRSKIIRAFLQGFRRNEIAKLKGGGGGTVTREFERFKKKVESEGIFQAAEEYDVSQIVEELQEIARLKRDSNLTNVDFADGAKLAVVLRKLGMNADELESFIEEVYKKSKDKGYSASKIVDDCSELDRLESEYGPFDELKRRYENIGSQIALRSEEAKKLKKEVEDLSKKHANMLEQYDVTQNESAKFAETGKVLLGLGLDVEILEDVSKVLNILKKEKFEPQSVVSKLRTIKDLEERTIQLEKEEKGLQNRVNGLKEDLIETEGELGEKKNIVDEVNRLEETKLSVDAIQDIRNIIVRISLNHRMSPAEAIKRFEDDIVRNYDALLGLQPKVKSLEQKKEEYESRKNEIEAYAALREKGVDDETILRWKSIIEKTKLNPKVIEEELKTNSNLKHLEDDAKKRIEDLKNQEKTLKERVSTLESKRQEIESAINAVKDSGITLIKQISDTLASKIEETSNRAETIVKALDGFVSETNQKLIDASSNVGERLKALPDQVNQMIDQAIKAGEKVGSLMPIADAYEFISTGKGEPEKVIPLASIFLVNLKNWLEAKEKLDTLIEMDIDGILTKLKG